MIHTIFAAKAAYPPYIENRRNNDPFPSDQFALKMSGLEMKSKPEEDRGNSHDAKGPQAYPCED